MLEDQQCLELVKEMVLVHPPGTDEYFVYSSIAGDRFELNQVAFAMLGCMDGTQTLEQIARTIASQFDEPDLRTIGHDLRQLSCSLLTEGVVRETSRPRPVAGGI